MLNQFSRTQLLIGKEAMDRLSKTRVAIFGIGGVGGYTAEALARSGVGERRGDGCGHGEGQPGAQRLCGGGVGDGI